MTFNDQEYWKAYYDKQNFDTPPPPSPFASYLHENNYIGNKSIIELGCGNGRDTIFFAKNGAKVTAIDQCSNTTAHLDQLKNIKSFPADFTNLKSLDLEEFDVIYSRFTIHSIDEEGEDRTLNWAYNTLKKGGRFCIEARTTKDPICGKGVLKGENIWFFNGHHRRFLDATVFKNKLVKLGFEIEFFKEANGFAVYKTQDPIVLRAIVKK